MSVSDVLTRRERVNRAMTHREHDRVPRHESFWGETILRWQSEGLKGGADAVLDQLESDFAQLVWYWPTPFPEQDVLIQEDDETRVSRDANGGIVRLWKNKSGTPEHIGWDCTSRSIWEDRYKTALQQQTLRIDIATARDVWRKNQTRNGWTYIAGVEPFECLRKVIGDELFARTVYDDPEWIVDMSKTFTDIALRNYDAVLATGIQPDGLWTYGDMAYRSATFCSPAAYRDLIWPQHRRLCDWAHAHGMKFIYHTDGDVNAVMDLYVEAGFDCVQPLESKASMDIRKLCPVYGQKLAMFGNIDVMKMITNDLDVIEAEIASKFAAGMQTRAYMYHSDHSVPPQVTWDTYRGIIDLVNRYGTYS